MRGSDSVGSVRHWEEGAVYGVISGKPCDGATCVKA